MTSQFPPSEQPAGPTEQDHNRAPSLQVYTGGSAITGGQEFRNLFQRRYEYARVLLELSNKQQTLIDEGEFSGLIELLLRKQTVLDELQAISQTDPPLLEQWSEKKDSLSVTHRQQCEKWLAQSEEVFAELMDLEQRCTSQLQHKRQATQSQLEAVSSTIHLQDAYSQPPITSRFDRSQ